MADSNLHKKLTYRDYCASNSNTRIEIIDGIVYDKSTLESIHSDTVPAYVHQDISMELARQIANFLVGKPCKVNQAPFDVILHEEGEEADAATTVLQPDIVVVCDETKRQKTCCVGAPDIVMEVLSPSTANYDMVTKRLIYEKHGVREYFIVDPERRLVMAFRLTDGKYTNVQIIPEDEKLTSEVLPGLEIDLSRVFAQV